MALELLSLNRQSVMYYSALSVGIGQDLPVALGGAAGADVVIDAEGNVRVLGVISGTQAPAAGFPRIRFWPSPGDATTMTAVGTYTLTVDPNNANTYLIDVPLYTPYFTIEWTMGAVAGTVTGIAWVFPEPSGSSSVAGGGTIWVKDAPLTPLGYGQGTVDGTTAETFAVLTGSAIPTGAIYALLQVDTGGTNVFCRWRDDGTAPTATVGFPLLTGVQFFYEGTLSAFRIIGSAAGPSTVSVSYYR